MSIISMILVVIVAIFSLVSKVLLMNSSSISLW